MAMAAMIPMMMTTMRSSMRVKPFSCSRRRRAMLRLTIRRWHGRPPARIPRTGRYCGSWARVRSPPSSLLAEAATDHEDEGVVVGSCVLGVEALGQLGRPHPRVDCVHARRCDPVGGGHEHVAARQRD